MIGIMSRELDEVQARALVQDYLDAMEPPGSDVWVITQAVRYEWGWAVYWVNRRAAEGSRAPSDLYAGAGPFLVERRTGWVALCGSAYPVEHYIQLWQDGQWAGEPPPAGHGPLPDSWSDLRPRMGDALARTREAMVAELSRELAPGHPLHGQQFQALAKCGHCDSVVFTLPGGRFAIVQLTWTRKSESLPWPHATVFREWVPVLAAMAEHGTGKDG